MSTRKAYSESQIPTGKTSGPYPDHSSVVNGFGRHFAEGYVAKVVGDGGVVSFVCPFYPAVIEVFEATGPTLAKSIFASDGAVHINGITGAVNASPPTVTAVDADDPSQGYTIGLPAALAPSGDTATVLCWGARDIGGSL